MPQGVPLSHRPRGSRHLLVMNPDPKGIDILEGPPPVPPRKPTLAREVLQLLSLFDEKGLGAVRDLEPQEQPLQAPVRIK